MNHWPIFWLKVCFDVFNIRLRLLPSEGNGWMHCGSGVGRETKRIVTSDTSKNQITKEQMASFAWFKVCNSGSFKRKRRHEWNSSKFSHVPGIFSYSLGHSVYVSTSWVEVEPGVSTLQECCVCVCFSVWFWRSHTRGSFWPGLILNCVITRCSVVNLWS
jgi:hypothetical protein